MASHHDQATQLQSRVKGSHATQQAEESVAHAVMVKELRVRKCSRRSANALEH